MDHLRVQKEIVKWFLGCFREKRSKRGHMGVLMCARLTAKHFIDWVPSRKKCDVPCGRKEDETLLEQNTHVVFRLLRRIVCGELFQEIPHRH